MTQQPFDPMDKLLREALASDALPPSDLTDRIMAQVERTPQGGSAASNPKRNYKKWLLTAAACLVIVGAAFPLALQGRAGRTDHAADDDATADTNADNDMVSSYYGGNRSDVPDGTAPSDGTGGDTEQAQKNNSAHDQPFDPMDSALDHAAALLEQQGCTLEVLARADDAVQVAIADADTHPSGNTDLLKMPWWPPVSRWRATGMCWNRRKRPREATHQATDPRGADRRRLRRSQLFRLYFRHHLRSYPVPFFRGAVRLTLFLPETAWGLGVGCLIANLLSPYGVLDIVVGSAATLLAALLTARCQKKWLAPLPPVIANTVLIGLVLAYEQAGTSAAFWPTYAFNALTVGLGEAVACYGLGGLLLWRLDKSNALQRYLQNR